MIVGKKILALIPARGGSKGLPGKNIRPLCGKPLLAHTIEATQHSKYIDEVIVSTDSDEIAQVASHYGSKIFIRSAHLATDTALVIDTIRDLIGNFKEFEYLILLQATSPLRQVVLIDKCIEQILEKDADSLATFSPAKPAPSQLWNINNNLASPFFIDSDPWLPRQQQKDAYHLNGLIYIFNINRFIEEKPKAIFFGNGIPFVIDQVDIDIDTLEDFELAEYMMKSKL
jgi:CMP-N,N'-diacetyllegionaminic acid synthase